MVQFCLIGSLIFLIQIDKASDPILSQNPFILCGAEWKEKRAEITPAFTVSRVSVLKVFKWMWPRFTNTQCVGIEV